MTVLSSVKTCANPDCKARFKRLGEGKITVFPIGNPELWRLPAGTKRKVVWLCVHCSSSLAVQADYRHHTIRLVHKAGAGAI
jgi:hypothetical protein